ncbi:MAG: hypothetical protein HXS50_03270 [Theionarchaea archaeon]|nr:hypothetical protein [Theionarchaea archaeon]
MSTRFSTIIPVILVLLFVCNGVGASVDPNTGKVRVLFMGDSEMQAGKITPILVLDPMLDLDTVPVEGLTQTFRGIEDAARGLRTYFPRVERQVHEGYDVLIIADAREPFFSHKLQNWFKNSVVEHGLGFLMGGGPQSFGGYGPWGHPSWEGSPVADVLPVTMLGEWPFADNSFRLVPSSGKEDHPLVRNIPWKQMVLKDYNRVLAKQGAIVVGESDNFPPGSPILTYWETGEGIGEAFVFDWGGTGPREFHRWSYGPIVLSNLIYWPAGVKIPEDTGLYLRVRNKMTNYLSLRSYTLSVIDFAERFGANLKRAEEAMARSDEDRREVISLYVEGSYDESLGRLDSALENLEAASSLAMKAKDEALFWVYVIEWFTVSGTGMMCGVVLWTLMVRRAAYREVATTRFDGAR